MTERRHGEINSQRPGRGEVFSRFLKGIRLNQPMSRENPYAEIRQELIYYIVGDWLPKHNRFQAVKKRLRTEQAVVKHRKVFGTDPQPTRDIASGDALEAAFHVLGSRNALLHPRYSLALLRAGITIDGDKNKQRKDAGGIFDKYLAVAKQVTPSTG